MYRKVDTKIWNDEKFCAFSDRGKLTFLMLLTHPSMTSLGAMRASLAGLAEEMGWDLRTFTKAFNEGCECGSVVYDSKTHLVYLPNFIKYNRPESPNVTKAWVKASLLLPECDLRSQIIFTAKVFLEGLGEAFQEAFQEAYGKAYLRPLLNQEQEQEQKRKEPIHGDELNKRDTYRGIESGWPEVDWAGPVPVGEAS